MISSRHREIEAAHRLALIEVGQQLFEYRRELLRVLVAGAALLALARVGFLGGGQVGEREFDTDRLDVGDRIDVAIHVHHVLVLETAHHIHDRVGLADIGQELVSKTLALGGAGHQSRDIDELDDRRLDLLRLDDFRKLREPRIRHLDNPDVRLDGAERVVLGLDSGLGQRVEERGLSDVGQANDAAFETHG